MATDIYRKTLIEISKRHKKMQKDPLYKKAYQFPDDKKGKKERNKILKELSKKYDLEGVYTFTSFANTYRNKRNYSDYIPSDVAGTLGRRAWDAYSKKMFNKGAKKVNFSKVVDSIEGIKDTGIMLLFLCGVYQIMTLTLCLIKPFVNKLDVSVCCIQLPS